MSRSAITFGPFRLDQEAVRLWNGDEPVALQPRPLAVLCYLAARPGALVGRDELLARVWDGTHVSRAVLKVAVRAVREALGDDADAPRYIETVGRDGYRFIGGGAPRAAAEARGAPPPLPALVRRERELALLHAALRRAAGGQRQLVLVTGEAGIGKTTLLDQFVAEAGRTGDAPCIARGQCLEQYGESEAYLPMLEAIGRLAREPHARRLGAILRRDAPGWVSQLPALGRTRAARAPSGRAIAPRPRQMLREMADALEAFTARGTLVLVLEDLQWSDPSTVDLLGYLARRRESARLLVVCSARSAEMIAHDHTLRVLQQELRAGGLCEEIPLELLSPANVGTYIATRFAGAPGDVLRRLAARINQCTEGNALFMVNMADDVVARGLLTWRDGRWHAAGRIDDAAEHVPVGLRALIGRRIGALAAAPRRVLETASVVGDEFGALDVAAALGEDVEAVDAACEGLASQATLVADAGVAEAPDGSVSGRYRFLHALYRRVLYDGIGAARRVRLHRTIGTRLADVLGPRAADGAAELAMHFTRGREDARALEFHELAGLAALDRHAAHEADGHFSAALDALARIGAPPADAQRELRLVVARATVSMALRGYAAPETERDYARARALSAALPPGPTVYLVLRGLLSYHQVRAEHPNALELGERLLRHADRAPADRALRVQAHYGHGATLFHVGALPAAESHLDAALRAYDPVTHQEHAQMYGGYDPGVGSSMWLAWTLALQGRLGEAIERDRAGLALARRLADPFSLAWACHAASVSQQIFGERGACEALASEAVQLAEEHGFPHVRGMATAMLGWAMITQGRLEPGIPLLRAGVAATEATGARLVRASYLGLLAAADAMQGDRAAAARGFDAALDEVERSGERVHQATLLIAKSHLLAAGGIGGRAPRSGAGAAEACLRRALEVAEQQGARLLALRAAVALARHCLARERDGEARGVLEAAHAWFADQPPLAPEITAARQLLARRSGAG